MKTVTFVWTPGHAGISGNEKAVEGAKKVLRQCLPPQSMVVAADMITRAKFNEKKSYRANLATSRQHHSITCFSKIIGRLKPNVKLNRHQQVMLSRFRMCHTHLTHSHHMTRQRSPICDQ
jgi:hypothetical protein